LRAGGADLAAGLDAGAVGQPNVHDDDVRLEASRLSDRLGHRARLGDDLEAGAPVEQRHQALSDDLVVVDDEEAQRPLGSLLGHRSSPPLLLRPGASVIMIRVPDGPLSTSKRPPSPVTRARMFARPWWPRSG